MLVLRLILGYALKHLSESEWFSVIKGITGKDRFGVQAFGHLGTGRGWQQGRAGQEVTGARLLFPSFYQGLRFVMLAAY